MERDSFHTLALPSFLRFCAESAHKYEVMSKKDNA